MNENKQDFQFEDESLYAETPQQTITINEETTAQPEPQNLEPDETQNEGTEEVELQQEGIDEKQTDEGPQQDDVQSIGEEPLKEDAETPQVEALEEIVDVVVQQDPEDVKTVSSDLPDSVQKLVDFLAETGGTMEDYVNLNKDFSSLSDEKILIEYYKATKPNWSNEDIKDHIEDELTIEGYVEGDELDREERRTLRKRKEEILNAQQHLQSQKDKYYENLKLSSNDNANQVAKENQARQDAQNQVRQDFESKTKQFFSEGFEGFVFEGGDSKKFRMKEPLSVKDNQLDLNQVIGKHLDDNGLVKDIQSYHKAIYAFNNADKISSHFYQQGKADALKERAMSSKNVDVNPQVDTQAPSTSKQKFSFEPDTDFNY